MKSFKDRLSKGPVPTEAEDIRSWLKSLRLGPRKECPQYVELEGGVQIPIDEATDAQLQMFAQEIALILSKKAN